MRTLSSSPLLFAVMAKFMSGGGKLIAGKATTLPSAHSVSPVTTSLSLAMAPMSPAPTLSTGFMSLPMGLSSWPRRSLWPPRATASWLSLATVPWKTRKTLTWPLNGSASVLKTNAAAGLSGSQASSTSVPSAVAAAGTAASAGDGVRASRSKRRSTPIRCVAEPQATGNS